MGKKKGRLYRGLSRRSCACVVVMAFLLFIEKHMYTALCILLLLWPGSLDFYLSYHFDIVRNY